MKSYALTLSLVGFGLASAFAAACGGNGATGAGFGGGGSDASGHPSGGGGSILVGGQGGDMQAITVTPNPASLKIELGTPGKTVQFDAVEHGTTISPNWAVSPASAGTIDGSGLFTANGLAGGEITVTATRGKDTGTAKLLISVHATENPGSVSPGDQGTLKGGGGTQDPNWRLVYPYDKTVFPSGTLAPEIHPSGSTGAPTAYYVHLTSKSFEYEGFFGAVPQITLVQAAWDALSSTTDGSNIAVEVSELVAGAKVGPIKQTWQVAPGKLHGTIYYNTYNSQVPMSGGGSMMRIKGNSSAPETLVGNCTVCHSVSADGSTAAAANHSGPGGIFNLSSGNVNPPNTWASPEVAAFAGLYPKNGEVFVTNGAPGGSYPPNTPGTAGPYASALYQKDGTLLSGSGIEGYYAMSPVFSLDGTRLAFCDRDITNTALSKLAIMKYDNGSHKFTGYEVLATPPAGHHFAWPAFTPDGKWVVFQDGVGEDLATWSNNTAKIWVVNVQSKALFALTTLNGDGYMPQGARDEDLNFEPTIAPIASGGYFWIMFTSRRTYGTRLPGDRNSTKSLWVAAFDIDAKDNKDPTHPAFHIPGQELTTGNSRGFWALDPCKKNGSSCESGDECCDGFCNVDPKNPAMGTCGPPTSGCAQEFESCTMSSDCCSGSALQCIGGHCSRVVPH